MSPDNEAAFKQYIDKEVWKMQSAQEELSATELEQIQAAKDMLENAAIKFPMEQTSTIWEISEELFQAKLKSYQLKTMQKPISEQIDITINSPTDNPGTSLLKQLFKQVINIWKSAEGNSTALGQNITNFIVKDTTHSNIAAYQSDFKIPMAFKIHKYSCIIQAAESKKEIGSLGSTKDYSSPKNYGPSDNSKDLKAKLEALENSLVKEQKLRQNLTTKYEGEIESLKEAQTRIIEVKSFDGSKMLGERIVAKHHKQLPEILQALTARNAMGFPEQLYIWGAPGAGKTHLAKQIAAALGVNCFAYPMGPTITEGKLLGFNNIATGTFVPGWLYNAFKNGGLVALDETDLADASVLGAANSIDNDSFIFGNGELVTRNPNFYLIAFANTIGTGSTKGFIRNTLDAATRDRFTVIKLDYDETLEKEIYGNTEWATYVQKVRDYVARNCQASIYITPRATRKGAAYLNAGIEILKVMDWCIFKGCSEDLKTQILTNVGAYQSKVVK